MAGGGSGLQRGSRSSPSRGIEHRPEKRNAVFGKGRCNNNALATQSGNHLLAIGEGGRHQSEQAADQRETKSRQ